MSQRASRCAFHLLTFILTLALSAAPLSAAPSTHSHQHVQPTPVPQSEGLTAQGILHEDTVWGPGVISLTGDVLVAAGITLVIAPGTTVLVEPIDQANLGADPGRIELMVQGTLQASGPLTITSGSADPSGGDWYGIQFHPGSGGWLDSAVVEYAVVGVSIESASPDITGNTIQHLRGDAGSAGAAGNHGGPGEAGEAGSPGEAGGDAYGIQIIGGSAPLISANIIRNIVGGHGAGGGNGGHGGAGAEGEPGIPGAPGGSGGAGADAGNGGMAVGISIAEGATPQVFTNTVQSVMGGAAGNGGSGGAGAAGGDGIDDFHGRHGGNGGAGGAAGASGEGGIAAGIRVIQGAGPEIAGNSLVDIVGGDGGRGGFGGAGGRGGNGASRPDRDGRFHGGQGGNGGLPGAGADGGNGGAAYGVYIDAGPATTVYQGNRAMAIQGGSGGTGGQGGRGGDGGHGGRGSDRSGSCMFSDCYAGDGGDGGRGGAGRAGGNGGLGGQGRAIHVRASTLATPMEANAVSEVYGGEGGVGGAAGAGGHGGGGGRGGNAAGSGRVYGGNGGDGGRGGNAGNGGSGTPGGSATGIVSSGASFDATNNVIATVAAGQAGYGRNGGSGGNGGYAGSGGWPSGASGWNGPGGSGGNGGHGAPGGTSQGLHFYGSAILRIANNTAADLRDGGQQGSPGGPGQSGRFGSSGGIPGSSSSPGLGIGVRAGAGISLTLSNTILAHTDSSSSQWTYGVDVEHGAGVLLQHNIIWNYAVPYLGTSAPASDLQLDPRFLGSAEFPGYYRLSPDSPCIDAGHNGAVLSSTDMDGQQRIVDGSDAGTGVVDIGAYEYQAYTLTVAQTGHGEVTFTPVQSTYNYLDQVVVTATTGTGWTFAGWHGDLVSDVNPLTVTLTDHTAITATFTQDHHTLTVERVPEAGGTVDVVPQLDSYPYGEAITLTVNANPGWTFLGWSGDARGTELQITHIVTADTFITATFTQDAYTLEVHISGDGTVTVEPEQSTYRYGDVVTLTATAEPGWSFAGWSGDATGLDDEVVVTIAGHSVIAATFTQDSYALEVHISGDGTVTVDPEQSTYRYGDVVTLTATAEPGWSFAGWSGDATGSEAELIVTIAGHSVITATFTQDAYALEVHISGDGTVTVDPEQSTYRYGDVVTLTATAEPGWSFAGWSGDATGSDDELVVTIAGDSVITATFTQDAYSLQVHISGDGTVTAAPQQSAYHYGDVVTLTATPEPGWSFAGWSGDATGLDAEVVVTIAGHSVITATFTQDAYSLQVHISGDGMVTVEPEQSTYRYGDVVTLTATAEPGWSFAGWSGNVVGSEAAITHTITADTVVTASFTAFRIHIPLVVRAEP